MNVIFDADTFLIFFRTSNVILYKLHAMEKPVFTQYQ